MAITKPYYRLWRPVKGYDWGNATFTFMNEGDNTPKPTLDYLNDEVFASQAEKGSLFNATRLILRDLIEIFDFIEPSDDNTTIYSHRIYELLLRAATEFETNCRGVLKANGYSKDEKDWNVKDYFKISRAARLNEYRVSFLRWATAREFIPFEEWNPSRREVLSWYDAYNEVKHDRFGNFKLANLENLMNSVAGLLSILHAQYGESMAEVGFYGFGSSNVEEGLVETELFTINAPSFLESEQYEFIWDTIKTGQEPVQKYNF